MNQIRSVSHHALVAVGLLLASHAHSATTYRLDELKFGANDINSSGTIVGGGRYTEPNLSTVVYSAGVMHDIHVYGSATAVSDNGLLLLNQGDVYDTKTGEFSQGASNIHSSHSPIQIRTIGINNNGTIVGNEVAVGEWDEHSKAVTVTNGKAAYIPTLGGNSEARAINNHGVITGFSQIAVGYMEPEHAYKYDGTVLTDLGVLPGYARSYGMAINDVDQVAGWATSADYFAAHAFVTSSKGLVDLGVLHGYENSEAWGINNSGHVVGEASRAFSYTDEQGNSFSGSQYHAFLYSQEEGMQDLNALLHGSSGQGWVLEQASGISDNGIIYGWGKHNGVSANFVLTPVPEPETAALVAAGLGILALVRRKARRRV